MNETVFSLRPVSGSQSRTSDLVRMLSEDIRSGRIKPGEKLPTEQEIVRLTGVSRTVVREAIARLSAKNLLQVRGGAGGGIVVRSPSPAHVSDTLSLLLQMDSNTTRHEKVLEVRRLLEVEIAGLAAERRTAADLAQLAANLAAYEAMRETTAADRERFAQLDLDFHTAIAAATQNDLFVILLDALRDILLALRRLGYSTPGNPQRALRHHHAIFAAINAGAAGAARQAMQAHLIEAEETVHLALALQQGQEPVDAQSQGAVQ